MNSNKNKKYTIFQSYKHRKNNVKLSTIFIITNINNMIFNRIGFVERKIQDIEIIILNKDVKMRKNLTPNDLALIASKKSIIIRLKKDNIIKPTLFTSKNFNYLVEGIKDFDIIYDAIVKEVSNKLRVELVNRFYPDKPDIPKEVASSFSDCLNKEKIKLEMLYIGTLIGNHL